MNHLGVFVLVLVSSVRSQFVVFIYFIVLIPLRISDPGVIVRTHDTRTHHHVIAVLVVVVALARVASARGGLRAGEHRRAGYLRQRHRVLHPVDTLRYSVSSTVGRVS